MFDIKLHPWAGADEVSWEVIVGLSITYMLPLKVPQYGSKFKVLLSFVLGFSAVYLGLSFLLFMLADWVAVILLEVEYSYTYYQIIS
jgi:hypothetical protein